MEKSILKSCLYSSLGYSVLMTVFSVFYFGVPYIFATILFIILFLAWFISVFIFTKYISRKQDKLVNDFSEQFNFEKSDVIYTGLANHYMNGEYVGGNLIVTNEMLIFKSHNLCLNKHTLTISLDDILNIEKYNTLGIVPNGIKVIQAGKIDKFVVNDRAHLLTILNKL